MSSLAERLQALVGDGYRVERELPLGGMSRLWVARDVAVGRDVVVKVLPPDLACTASTVRFRREVELTAQLLHPNIVPVLSAGGTDGLLYYITPFVAGESLRELLARDGALPLAAVLRVLDDVLDALAYAHSRGVVHRDVKPGNILLPADGRAMLADFGIANALSAAETTASDATPGTPAYMAPEHPSDAHADLWATCVVAHEMLTGARPGAGVTAAEIVKARAKAVGTREGRRAEALAEVVARGLSPEPARRWASAEALRAATTRAREPRWLTRRTLGVAAAVVLVAVAGFATTRPSVNAARMRERGRAAEARFELDSAIGFYRGALAHDSSDATSRLGLARALTWRGTEADLAEAVPHLRASVAGDVMPSAARRRATARALLALAEGRFVDACRAFDSLTVSAPSDGDAWVGLAECRRRDGTVVADATSPSGFSFRSSYAAAAAAYERALEARTPAQPMLIARLSRVLFTDPNRLREGRRTEGRDTVVLVAYQTLSGDSLSFVPWPITRLRPPEGTIQAMESNLARLRLHHHRWVRASPRDPRARLGLAEVLERMGNIDTPGPDETTALDELREARRYTDSASAISLMHVEARLRMKAGDWVGMLRVSDSALTRRRDASASEAERLAGLAAATGRRASFEGMLRTLADSRSSQARDSRGRPVDIPPAVMIGRAQLIGAVLLGSCDETRAALARLDRLLAAHVPTDSARRHARRALIERPASMATSCLGNQAMLEFEGSADPLVRLQQHAARGDLRALRAMMLQLDRLRQAGRAGDVSLDHAFGEASLLASIGDSSAALRRLDIAFDGLETQNSYVLAEPFQAASLPRAMELAARLAFAQGDERTWRHWSDALTTLWASADAPLKARALELRAMRRGR